MRDVRAEPLGETRTAPFRSDGTAVSCGWRGHGRCDTPALVFGDLTYAAYMFPLSSSKRFGGDSVRFLTLRGTEHFRATAPP